MPLLADIDLSLKNEFRFTHSSDIQNAVGLSVCLSVWDVPLCSDASNRGQQDGDRDWSHVLHHGILIQ